MSINWTASNNSSFLNGTRTANTLLGAVRAARTYVDSELMGEGVITYYEGNYPDYPIRQDRKDIYTGYKWATTTEM